MTDGMSQHKIAVFAYNFPHKKTQDFLLRMFLEGIKIDCIFAADPVELNIPKSTIRSKIRSSECVHPRKIAERLGIDYFVMPHDSKELINLAKARDINFAVITGARVLKSEIIKAFPLGILNFHPGLIPEARGLDAMLWSIYKDVPLGVTAHLIDEKVDAGLIISKEIIKIYKDDSIFDLSERLYEKQINMLVPAIFLALEKKYIATEISVPYNRKMSPEIEREVSNILPEYIKKITS